MAFPPDVIIVVLAGLLAAVLLLLVLILAVLVTGRRRASAGRVPAIEPMLDYPGPASRDSSPRIVDVDAFVAARPRDRPGHGHAAAGHAEPLRGRSASPAPAPTPRRFRLGWFAVGFLAGVAATVVWGDPTSIDRSIERLAALAGPALDLIRSRTTREPELDEDRVPAVAANPSPDEPLRAGSAPTLGRLVESYVAALRRRLPMATAPGVALVSAHAEGDVITLEFEVAESLVDQGGDPLPAEFEPRLRATVCDSEPGPDTLHGLNERGATIEVVYADPIGRIVAEMTAEPRYCG